MRGLLAPSFRDLRVRFGNEASLFRRQLMLFAVVVAVAHFCVGRHRCHRAVRARCRLF